MNVNIQSNKIIEYYSENSQKFASQYEGISTQNVFGAALKYFPQNPSLVLDIGSGSGRDAVWMSKQGSIVTAVEPADGMRKIAMELHKDHSINWVSDKLPYLSNIDIPEYGFNFILISAVWMHLNPEDRIASLKKLYDIISNNGNVLISLRHGVGDDNRPMLLINNEIEIKNALKVGFKNVKIIDMEESDKLGRNDVYWNFLLLSKS